jgi:sec-independent protein translocase protein TatB
MFDIGFFELCVIGIVALLVLGPERLPRAARTAGMWVGRAKRMIAQVKRDIDEELRQEDLQELRELRDAKETLSKTKESISSFREELNKQIDSQPDKSGEPEATPSETPSDVKPKDAD